MSHQSIQVKYPTVFTEHPHAVVGAALADSSNGKLIRHAEDQV